MDETDGFKKTWLTKFLLCDRRSRMCSPVWFPPEVVVKQMLVGESDTGMA